MTELTDDVTTLNRRAFATVVLAVVSLLSALAAATAAYLVRGAQSGAVTHYAALFFGWFVGATVAMRYLRRRWSGPHDPSSVHLFLASASSLVATVGLAVVTAPWQDLMSQPGPTPVMVVKDLISTFAPLVAGLFAPWYVLGLRRT